VNGVFAPIPTPFDQASGDVALHQLRRNVSRLLADGVNGIVVSGSTGEAPLLDADEQRRLVATAREAMQDGAWLVAGTGAESTRQTVQLTKAAAEEGADAVLVRPPGYFANAVNPATLAGHFRAVADASPIPVLLYNIPKYTHLPLAAGLLQQLDGHERIAGVKDSSGDLKNLAAYRAAVPSWTVFAGSASLLYAALELGCQGGVIGVACFAPRLCVSLVAAFQNGDRVVAGRMQERVGPLDKEIVGKWGPAGVKAAMDAVGLYGGPPRAPLAPISATDRERIAALVRGD